MTIDRNFSAGNQDINRDARRAVPAGNGRLTAGLFETAGVAVGMQPVPAVTSKVGLHQPSKVEIIRRGEEAMAHLAAGRSWNDWVAVMRVLDIARTTAMLETNTNKPQGPRYREAIARWFRLHPAFGSIDKADRNRLHKCFDNLDAIDDWRRNHVSPQQLLKLNYPTQVLSRWESWKKRSAGSVGENGPAPKNDPEVKEPKPELAVVIDGMSDDELAKQLPAALPFDRFLRILSQDWRAKIESRLSKRPHVVTAEAFIKASEILRRALSLMKAAATPGITPVVAASNEKEALAALRGLNTVLAGTSAGTDEVTIVHQYAKERRCAKERRGARGRRRAA